MKSKQSKSPRKKLVDAFPKLNFQNSKISLPKSVKLNSSERKEFVKKVVEIVRENRKYMESVTNEQNTYPEGK